MKSAVFIALCISLSANAKLVRFTGQAESEDGRVAYVEKHELKLDGKRIKESVTRYFDRAGKLIAELRSDYSRDPFIPDYEFKDLRFDISHGIRWKDGKVLAFNQEEGKKESSEISRSQRMVGGQGFNWFIRENIESLAKASSEEFDLIFPGRLDHYRFSIEPKQSSEKDIRAFKISPTSFLLAMFVTTMRVEYSPDGRLRKYYGPSNLYDKKGKTQNVTILYRYEDENKAPVL